MPNSTDLIEGTLAFATWLLNCALLPIATPDCKPFWLGIVYLCATIGTAVIGWLIWKQIDFQMKYKAAIRAQAERERIADPETMKQHLYLEAGDVAADVTDPHLAEKIRKELERQRLERIRNAQS